MSNPIKFKDGIANAVKDTTLSEYIEMDPTRVITFFNDFHTWLATDWVDTAVSTGAGTSAAVMSDTYVGGAIVITNAASDNDCYWCQQSHDGGTNDSEVWRIQRGKKAWMKTKFQGADVDQTDFMVGIHIADTTPVASAPSDGVWFHSPDESAKINFHCVKNSTATSSIAIGDVSMVDNTDITVGFYWDGVSIFKLYVNDIYVGSMVATTVPDDEYMAISFGCQNGEATANTMTIDYIFAACER